ncbi:hypothetical protein amrb99_09600 [Actinomadura sp. RB99]|uniref:hypothetical protein n=1 Tax=Actinomadura sp. RB99 TaxID=2691577 RepID=UPI0019969610|nr:hypothetical protein [Actinomadura sp. RB99]
MTLPGNPIGDRCAAVLPYDPSGPSAAPPGVDDAEFRLAMLEDVYEVAAGLEFVTAALVADPDGPADAESITWPGTPIVRDPAPAAAFAALHALGAREAALIVPDAPDLPPLLLGKLFRALGSAPAAACQAADGNGLVALAARLPLPAWLAAALDEPGTAHGEPGTAHGGSGTVLDAPDGLARLRAAAPRPGLVPQGPGWHRIRTPADLRFLDPGLEGWDNTRALLEGSPLR